MAMSSLAHVLPKRRAANEETPQAIGCGCRGGVIAEWGVSDVELQREQYCGVTLGCAHRDLAPGCLSS